MITVLEPGGASPVHYEGWSCSPDVSAPSATHAVAPGLLEAVCGVTVAAHGGPWSPVDGGNASLAPPCPSCTAILAP